MQIKRLYVKNFRNIREQEFCFHENVNVLCGNNAQGKTNLCEAISLCMGPSFRTRYVTEKTYDEQYGHELVIQ